jgi:hypothetical protein
MFKFVVRMLYNNCVCTYVLHYPTDLDLRSQTLSSVLCQWKTPNAVRLVGSGTMMPNILQGDNLHASHASISLFSKSDGNFRFLINDLICSLLAEVA